MIKKLLEEYGFEKAQNIYGWIPKHNPITWGHTNWGAFYVKNWNDLDTYLNIANDIKEQDYERLK